MMLDDAVEVARVAGWALDDPPGFTPEQRAAVRTYLEGGGYLLVGLGPRAASPPLGASLEPIFSEPVRWEPSPSEGATVNGAWSELGASAASLATLSAPKRATVNAADARSWEALVRWSDGPPLALRKVFGRGEVWTVTLPFAVEASDLPLRPGFLSLVHSWAAHVRSAGTKRRVEVGEPWVFAADASVKITPPIQRSGAASYVPENIGVYKVVVNGREEQRVAMPIKAEITGHAYEVKQSAGGQSDGARRSQLDVSRWAAGLVLVLLVIEGGLRAIALRSAKVPA